MMSLDELKRILDLVREHDLSELELEQKDFKVRIKTGLDPRAGAVPHVTAPPASHASPQLQPTPLPAPESPLPDADEGLELAVIKSPIVGTFYRAPDPAAPPFVELGQIVRTRQVLCIIEAMKLMNEIESEYEGELVKIYVENGQPVQYGERLFAVKVK